MSVEVLIGGDICPTQSNYNLFSEGRIDDLLGSELKEVLRSADYTIFNLEVPLTDKKEPLNKCGPNLIAPTGTIVGLGALNPHFFGLANNHILDQGEDGLNSTIELLKKHGISYSGAGSNLDEARTAFIYNVKDITIGIYCCAEHEFTIAEKNKAGANPFDALESFDHTEQLKKECDFVIVLYHGGKEHYRYPSPQLQKICRKFVDKGADLVVCQHSHCIGCEEKWNAGTIVYGQGNFLFDNSESEYWKSGLLISCTFDTKDTSPIISYIPIAKNGCGVRLAQEAQKEGILKDFYIRSSEIQKEGFIEKQYTEFAKKNISSYLYTVLGIRSRMILRIFNKLSGYRFFDHYAKRIYRSAGLLAVQNIIECEAHRELFLGGIKESIVEMNRESCKGENHE